MAPPVQVTDRLDTREKIVSFANLLAAVSGESSGQSWIVVPGLFDPMTATQANRLEAYAQAKKLAVVVLDQPETLLDASSRCILVAALRAVSVVAIADLETWQKTRFDCQTVAYNETENRRATTEFIELIVRRTQ